MILPLAINDNFMITKQRLSHIVVLIMKENHKEYRQALLRLLTFTCLS